MAELRLGICLAQAQAAGAFADGDDPAIQAVASN